MAFKKKITSAFPSFERKEQIVDIDATDPGTETAVADYVQDTCSLHKVKEVYFLFFFSGVGRGRIYLEVQCALNYTMGTTHPFSEIPHILTISGI